MSIESVKATGVVADAIAELNRLKGLTSRGHDVRQGLVEAVQQLDKVPVSADPMKRIAEAMGLLLNARVWPLEIFLVDGAAEIDKVSGLLTTWLAEHVETKAVRTATGSNLVLSPALDSECEPEEGERCTP